MNLGRSGLVVSASDCSVRNQVQISPRTVVFIMVATVFTISYMLYECLQCFDAVGWAAGRASDL